MKMKGSGINLFLKNLLIIITLELIFLPIVLAQEPFELEKIIITPKNSLYKTNHSLETFSAEEIKQRNPGSLVGLLNYFSGMDIRFRGTFDIQGDLSLRGSTYEQVAVLVDGIRLNDPQTGHHNLDIPLTKYDVQKVEVIKEGSSSLYGAGALAGSVNIMTKKPTKKSLNVETLFGEHALFGKAMSFSLPGEDFASRISLEHKISSGARPNTDFENSTASFYLTKEWGKTHSDILFGYQKKDFGADSFYSNLFPEEEEHTSTIFVRTGLESKLDFGTFKNNLFLRKHRDKFILKRNNPISVNYHTTYVYGFNSNLLLPTKVGEFLLGLDTGRDQIHSTNLGIHSRLHEAGLFNLTAELTDKLTGELGLRLDHYQRWSWQKPFNLGLSYNIADKLRLRGSLAEAFRLPSFTELYYADAANIGNPDLGIEKSDNFTLGLDFRKKLIDLSLEAFLRRGHNLIDWTRTSEALPWQATNLGGVDFTGIDFKSKLRPHLNYKGLNLDEISFSYTYTEADKKTTGFFSKYALDILKHQFILGIDHLFWGLAFNWQLSYKERYYGETYFVGNIYVGKRLINKNFILEPFARIDNFTNTKYTEVSGVLEPDRWIQVGIKLQW